MTEQSRIIAQSAIDIFSMCAWAFVICLGVQLVFAIRRLF
jgi:hypothetical protein